MVEGMAVVVVVVVAVIVLATDETTVDAGWGGGPTGAATATTWEAEVPGGAVLGETLMEGGITTPEGREGGS